MDVGPGQSPYQSTPCICLLNIVLKLSAELNWFACREVTDIMDWRWENVYQPMWLLRYSGIPSQQIMVVSLQISLPIYFCIAFDE